jgi:NAD(P)-dependent dehydrogenase (short-subunit alcohol dehydrogenase family)
MSKFEPSNLPNLSGQVAIVTGGHSGLLVVVPILRNMLTKFSGLGTTVELLRHGATVYIASRSRDKGEAAIKLLRLRQPTADVHFLACDLGDLEIVKTAADEFIQYVSRALIQASTKLECRKERKLHILVNNAGVCISLHSSATC